MRGIETAFWGVLGKEPRIENLENRKSIRDAKRAVAIGKADDHQAAAQR